ncbi:MAG: transcription antitermination factor NusB [Bacteroidales bacterium]|nr:transcription antitermination factor NusB [Bacteroidales bacterium]
MISRRLLRIKALTILYAFNRRAGNNLETAENELVLSIGKTYDLYHYLLILILDIADLAREKIEIAKQKQIPTREDLNPNRRFIDNRFISQLAINQSLRTYTRNRRLSWSDNPELIRKLYNAILLWDGYKDYMSAETAGYSDDKKFIGRMINEVIMPSDELAGVMEEKSIYWNDDLDVVLVMIERTLRGFRERGGEEMPLVGLYKNEEDERFVKVLLRKAIIHSEEYFGLIDKHTTNWEIERIALMDTLVMVLALAEIVEFDEVPVKVTLNEYIEIAKYYCTAKSGIFVNGILDKIVREMRENKLFTKRGRGLVGEPGITE